jgi:hypothetical protein
MEPTDITIEILKDIRAEIRETRLDLSHRLDETNGRLDQTNERLDTMREELSRRIVDSEIRTSTAITELTGTVHEMTEVLRASHDLRPPHPRGRAQQGHPLARRQLHRRHQPGMGAVCGLDLPGHLPHCVPQVVHQWGSRGLHHAEGRRGHSSDHPARESVRAARERLRATLHGDPSRERGRLLLEDPHGRRLQGQRLALGHIRRQCREDYLGRVTRLRQVTRRFCGSTWGAGPQVDLNAAGRRDVDPGVPRVVSPSSRLD